MELSAAVQKAASFRNGYCAMLQREIKALQDKCLKYAERVLELEGLAHQRQPIHAQQQEKSSCSCSPPQPCHESSLHIDQGDSRPEISSSVANTHCAEGASQEQQLQQPQPQGQQQQEQQHEDQQRKQQLPGPLTLTLPPPSQPLGPIAMAAQGQYRSHTPPPAPYQTLPLVPGDAGGLLPFGGGMMGGRRSSMPTICTHSLQGRQEEGHMMVQRTFSPGVAAPAVPDVRRLGIEAAGTQVEAGLGWEGESLQALDNSAASAGALTASHGSGQVSSDRPARSRSGALDTGSEVLAAAVQATVASVASRSASGGLLSKSSLQPPHTSPGSAAAAVGTSLLPPLPAKQQQREESTAAAAASPFAAAAVDDGEIGESRTADK